MISRIIKFFLAASALSIVAEILIYLVAAGGPHGYSMLKYLPDKFQSAYINYLLEPDFDYFKNCSRKSILFRTIDDHGESLSFNRELLIPYLNRDLEGLYDCPLLTEPGPQIALREMATNNGGKSLLLAVRRFKDKSNSTPTYCSYILSNSNYIKSKYDLNIISECQQ